MDEVDVVNAVMDEVDVVNAVMDEVDVVNAVMNEVGHAVVNEGAWTRNGRI
jgi:hypothetical protein